ncbi:MAG: sulfite exporter TauE/SafE family protein [Clostridia bacterium]|nr:sulfite exporter TauE/SafE family protein [Clostridia bacterium]
MLIVSMIVSFVIAALSGMGVGGGGLFVIYLALFTDTPQLAAQGMNLLFFLFSAGASMVVHLRTRQLYGLVILVMAASGVVGAMLGAYLSNFVSQEILRRGFGAMLVISGILVLRKKQRREKPERA